eukprot:scaffold5150_cov133-Skeletonema_menzelii.AAC.13
MLDCSVSRLQCEYGGRFIVRSEESVESLVVAKGCDSSHNKKQHQDLAAISVVVTVDQNGIKSTIHADQFVIAMGNGSRPLCDTIHMPCPIYPVKGHHLVTISSADGCFYNITLPSGFGYEAPMDPHKVNGECIVGLDSWTLRRRRNLTNIKLKRSLIQPRFI